MDGEERMNVMTLIAGAAAALDFKEKNPNAMDAEIMQHVSDNAKEILGKIDG